MTRESSVGMKSTQISTKCFHRKCVLAFSITMAVISSIIFIVFWCTRIFNDAILSNVVINSPARIETFKRSPIRAAYKVYIFNYTNFEEFKMGKDKKLKVEEVGPYIYRETLTRINEIFHSNGTVSFQEHRSYKWEGGRPENDTIVVPHISLIAVNSMISKMNTIEKLAVKVGSWTFNLKPFLTLRAYEYLWGYDDEIFNIAKFTPYLGDVSSTKLGVLAHKNGTFQDRITMYTGESDIEKLGVIERVNGLSQTKQMYGDEHCDNIRGTQGYMFPTGTFDKPDSPIEVFSVDMCRSWNLYRNGTGSSYGIPTIIYKPPLDLFTFSPNKDYCYCLENTPGDPTTRQCPLAGLFNASQCTYNMPVLISFPHFYAGDESLRNELDGLNPQAEIHESLVELHPRLGIILSGHSRLQINIMVTKSDNGLVDLFHPEPLRIFKNRQVLPLVWVDVSIDHIPEPLLSQFKFAYHILLAIEIGAQWGSIIGIILSWGIILYIVMKKPDTSHTVPITNVSEMFQNKLISTKEINQ